MGFVLPYAPKLMIIAGILIVAMQELCGSLLEMVGLKEEEDPNGGLQETEEGMAPTKACLPSLLFAELPAGILRSSSAPPNLLREDCAVCLCEFQAGHRIQIWPACLHFFHAECIDQWLSHDQRSCPLCRSPLCKGPCVGLPSHLSI